MAIDTWNDFYQQLWTQAAHNRGTVSSVGEIPGATRYSTLSEWPRTTGADAMAIVSVIDPILSAEPLRPGGYGITRLWQTAVVLLAYTGLRFCHASALHWSDWNEAKRVLRIHVRRSPCFFAFTISARSFASSRRVFHFAWIASPGWAGSFLTRTSRTIASWRQIGATCVG